MVSLPEVQASNAQIATSLPPGLVAVFVGATSGIGETALKEFARNARQPRVYFVGRSQDAGNRITAECRQLNPEGEFIFIKADCSLIKAVDEVCREIKDKENAINLLFLISFDVNEAPPETSEGMHVPIAVAYYARTRFALNLLPLLRQATSLRRVVSVLAGGKEGAIHPEDFQSRKLSLLTMRAHLVSMTDLALEALAQRAPEVSFVHSYPGAVKTGIGKDVDSILVSIMGAFMFLFGWLFCIPIKESGERHLFLATSAKYPARGADKPIKAVPVSGDVQIAVGTDGESGSGVYSVNWDGEGTKAKVVGILGKLRQQGMDTQVWEHTVGEFRRITGVGEY
ncbi:Short-chain dehydrogenase/reductase SDR [Penicillium riverlandense]|uniref:Short-chain dehydrogenase/reductase SDR n=1 Tax=Penicillium riverlandense TaxID=1903569 RepID=UPI0025467D15|nr:Short-chain dehydrogenase/reductase SDR [Penicillium riverlandense]KAJ5825589.1 Short-chain dehydrogenase/reductase SDR [Penicillium riverlandense]